jgi:hypothetical protein
VNFSGQASCWSQAAVPGPISSPDQSPAAPSAEAVPPEVGTPISRPHSLQRITDLRAGRLPLRSPLRLASTPRF